MIKSGSIRKSSLIFMSMGGYTYDLYVQFQLIYIDDCRFKSKIIFDLKRR